MISCLRQGAPPIAPQKGTLSPFTPYAPSEKYVKYLEDVYILSPWGIILDKNFEPIWDTANEIIYWCGRPQQFPDLVQKYGLSGLGEFKTRESVFSRAKFVIEDLVVKARAKGDITELDASFDYIYGCHPFDQMVFGHLYDTLQRFHPLDGLPSKKSKLIISSPQHITDFSRHLEILGFNYETIIRKKELSLLKVPSLLVGEMACFPAGLNIPTHDWFFEKYVLNNSRIVTQPEQDLKLYLDRSSVGRAKKRNIIRAEEVGQFLSSKGFVTHEAFQVLDDVINAYYNASTIIGAHGAAFSNIMFCGPSTKIYELMPHNRYVPAFAKLPKKTLDYWLIKMEGDSDFNIDPSVEFISELVSGQWEKRF
ncbi:MAG: hypothetical protein ACJAS1_006823 [Oleiphilaceae bacterium]|jgi:hypothetical protein